MSEAPISGLAPGQGESMDQVLVSAIDEMERLLAMLSADGSRPWLIERQGRKLFRYAKPGIREALIQKLACAVSGLNATALLLEQGYVQEAAAEGRILDDVNDDIGLFAKALLVSEPDPDNDGEDVVAAVAMAHDVVARFLASFNEELIDNPQDVEESLVKRRSWVSRGDVRGAIEGLDKKLLAGASIESTTRQARALRVLHNSYVHGGTSQVMDMYGGDPPRFHVSGVPNRKLMDAHMQHFALRVERFVMGFSLAGMALRAPEVVEGASSLRVALSPITGTPLSV